MFIQIDERWAIASDEHNWIIKRKGVDEDRWRNYSFLPSFERAVQRLAERKIRMSGATTLAEAISDAKKVKKEICNALDVNCKLGVKL